MKISNRNLIIATIVLLTIIVVLLAGILIYAICSGGDLSFDYNKSEIVFDESFDAADVSKISVDSTFGNINIKQIDSDKIRVFTKDGNEEYFNVVSKNGVIAIENKSNKQGGVKLPSLFRKRNVSSDIDVYIPENCIDKIEINSDFGNVNIDSIQGISIKVDCNCGNIKADYLNSDFDLNTDMGDIKIDKINITNHSFATSSMGNIEIKSTNDVKIDYDTSMGDCNVKRNNPSSSITLKAQTSMGDIEIG